MVCGSKKGKGLVGKRVVIDHFYNYLNAYSEEYYSKYLLELDLIGELFCNMEKYDDLQLWLQETSFCGRHPYQKMSVPSPAIVIGHDQDYDKKVLPAYAVALKEFFYKEYPYPEYKNEPSERKRVTELEIQLANICHSGRSTVASWKSGTRLPDKYKWWVLAIGVFKLSYWHIQPYLDMVGSSVDMTCLDDVILFYSLCTSKSIYGTFVLLQENGCDETKRLFAAAGERA